jgi:hypothetical protein
MLKADTVSGGRVAGSGGGARCRPASASCTHAASTGSMSMRGRQLLRRGRWGVTYDLEIGVRAPLPE